MPLSKVVRVTGTNWRGGIHSGDGGTPGGKIAAAAFSFKVKTASLDGSRSPPDPSAVDVAQR